MYKKPLNRFCLLRQYRRSIELLTSTYPFIHSYVHLLQINSSTCNECSLESRRYVHWHTKLWSNISNLCVGSGSLHLMQKQFELFTQNDVKKTGISIIIQNKPIELFIQIRQLFQKKKEIISDGKIFSGQRIEFLHWILHVWSFIIYGHNSISFIEQNISIDFLLLTKCVWLIYR